MAVSQSVSMWVGRFLSISIVLSRSSYLLAALVSVDAFRIGYIQIWSIATCCMMLYIVWFSSAQSILLLQGSHVLYHVSHSVLALLHWSSGVEAGRAFHGSRDFPRSCDLTIFSSLTFFFWGSSSWGNEVWLSFVGKQWRRIVLSLSTISRGSSSCVVICKLVWGFGARFLLPFPLLLQCLEGV